MTEPNTHFLSSSVTSALFIQTCCQYNTSRRRGKGKLTGFFWPRFKFSCIPHFKNIPSPSPSPSLRPYVQNILAQVERHLKVGSQYSQGVKPFWFVCNVQKFNIKEQKKTQVEQEKGSRCLSLDAFPHSDLFWRWFRDTPSPWLTGTTRGAGSGGYWPARR